MKRAKEIYRDFSLPWMGVEKNGIGQGILQTIKSHGLTVKPILAHGSKEARSEIAEIRMNAGLIYFPQNAPWLWDLQQELLAWPNSQHSDQVGTNWPMPPRGCRNARERRGRKGRRRQ